MSQLRRSLTEKLCWTFAGIGLCASTGCMLPGVTYRLPTPSSVVIGSDKAESEGSLAAGRTPRNDPPSRAGEPRSDARFASPAKPDVAFASP